MAAEVPQNGHLGPDTELVSGHLEEGGTLWRCLVSSCQRAVVWLLSLGPVPKHVCLLPDGHRRFSRATRTDLRKVYAIGAKKYFRLRDWCYRAGVEVLSVFTFSVRNLSRNSFEFTAALNRANQIHADIVENLDVYRSIGMWACACGDLERLPEYLRTSLARAQIATSSSSDKSLKRQVSCAAYSTTNQMTRMARHLAQAVKDGALRSEHFIHQTYEAVSAAVPQFLIFAIRDITVEFFHEYVTVTESPEAEMVLRSAGDQRFSDYQVLQCNYAYFHLEPKKWPAVGFMEWVRAMLHFQLQWPKIQARHNHISPNAIKKSETEQVMRQRTFLRQVDAAKLLNLERLASEPNAATL